MYGARPTTPANRHILLVEDDRQVSTVLCPLLESEGYRVQWASDGRQAMDSLRASHRPDLIVLDLMMPGMDGWEFRTLQRADPVFREIPVLAISADSTTKATAIDASGFLPKPFRFTDLLSRIDQILGDCERLRSRDLQNERLAVLGTVAASAMHEISNPLCCVLAHLASIEAQLARGSVEDLHDSVRSARIGTDRVCGVVRSLRSIAR